MLKDLLKLLKDLLKIIKRPGNNRKKAGNNWKKAWRQKLFLGPRERPRGQKNHLGNHIIRILANGPYVPAFFSCAHFRSVLRVEYYLENSLHIFRTNCEY